LQKSRNGKTDLFKELISELRVGNGQILSKLAFEGLLLVAACLMTAVTAASLLSSLGVSS
jgi:hypothetical protein